MQSEGAARCTPLGILHLLSGSKLPRPYLPCCFRFLFAVASPIAADSQRSGACSLPPLWPGRLVTASSAAARVGDRTQAVGRAEVCREAGDSLSLTDALCVRRCCKPFSELGKAVSTLAQTLK